MRKENYLIIKEENVENGSDMFINCMRVKQQQYDELKERIWQKKRKQETRS